MGSVLVLLLRPFVLRPFVLPMHTRPVGSWIRRNSRTWIQTTTPKCVRSALPPVGKVSVEVFLIQELQTRRQSTIGIDKLTRNGSDFVGSRYLTPCKTEEGEYVRVTPALIKGHGTDATPHNYSFLDETGEIGKIYYYYIEDVDFAGNKDKSHIIKVGVPTSKGKLTTTWAAIKKR